MGYVMTVLVGWMQPEGRQTDSLTPCSIGRLVSSGFVSSRVGLSRAESSGIVVRSGLCLLVERAREPGWSGSFGGWWSVIGGRWLGVWVADVFSTGRNRG